LEVILPDDKTVHVTAVSSGFFVNKSKGAGPRTKFDPSPEENSHFSHTLLDCLVSWSASLRASWVSVKIVVFVDAKNFIIGYTLIVNYLANCAYGCIGMVEIKRSTQ
jgi:hypothetical protein